MKRLARSAVFIIAILTALNFQARGASSQDGRPEEEKKLTSELARLAEDPSNPNRLNHLLRLSKHECPELEPTVKRCLADTDEKILTLAAEIAAEKEFKSLAPDVAKLMRHASPTVMACAADAAAELDIAVAAPVLVELLDSPLAGIRETANRDLKKHTGFSFGFDPDDTPEARAKAVSAWSSWLDSNKTSPPAEWWMKGLTDPSSANRVASCQRLAGLHHYPAIPILISTLADQSPAVRHYANYALTRITAFDFGFDADATPEIMRKTVSQWEEWWAESKDLKPSQWWINGLSHPSPKVRSYSLYRLKDEKEFTAVPELANLLISKDEEERVSASGALEAVTGVWFPGILRGGSADPEKIRAAWMEWWDENKGRETPVDRLVATMAASKYSETRASAAESLAKLVKDRAVSTPFLFKALEDPNARVRESAFISLRQLNGLKVDFDAEAPDKERAKKIDEIYNLLFPIK